MAYSRLHFLGLLLGVFLLAACGNAASQATSPSPGASATRSAAPTAAPAPAAQAQPTALAPQPSAAPDALASIPESTTPEGYHILGRADAPVTLTMYSDFL